MKHVQAHTREEHKKASVYRKEGQVPAVIYGHKMPESISLVVESVPFDTLYKEVGGNTVVEVKTEEGSWQVLVHDTQRHPLSGQLTHVDFLAVSMDEVVEAMVPLVFTGESALIKGGEYDLVTNMDEVQVKCLPGDLPKEITLDLSVLTEDKESIAVSELPLGEKVEVMLEGDTTVVGVVHKKEEEEVEITEDTETVPESVKEEAEAAEEGEKEKDAEKK